MNRIVELSLVSPETIVFEHNLLGIVTRAFLYQKDQRFIEVLRKPHFVNRVPTLLEFSRFIELFSKLILISVGGPFLLARTSSQRDCGYCEKSYGEATNHIEP